MTGSSASNSTSRLLALVRTGDASALEQLLERHLPRLQRWATGRLPRWARDMADTHDLVQESVWTTFRNIERFEHRGPGALYAYLRQVLLNRIRDELRKAGRRPGSVELDERLPADLASPLEALIGRETLQRYEAALSKLRPHDRDVIALRVELGFTNEEIAELLGKPSANAARMAVERALARLAAEMERSG